jgi:phospholipid/cholesterol/gamma-HCH transport system substrate-binding protein
MRSSETRILRLGAITLVVMALISAATFNLGRFPGFRGTTYYAEFSDASGIHKGNIVQVGGIRVGRVTDVVLDDDRVRVRFEVDGDVEFGPESTASIEVLNLLGEKYLDLQPAGEGRLASGGTIPLERTEAAYDIVGVFGDLTRTTEEIDTKRLSEALDVVAGTVDGAAPEIGAAFDGIARLSRSVSQRDEQIQTLLRGSERVSKVLERRGEDIVELMGHSDLVFKELRKRKRAVHRLLVNATTLAEELRGLARDNAAQIGPALAEVDELTGLLVEKQKQLKATLHELGPYVEILSNIIGTGPWFDAVAVNIATIPTGEFVPGFPE